MAERVFKVGDAVRVKAGSPVYRFQGDNKEWPSAILFGCKFKHIGNMSVSDAYLEPWNDAEEWDGSKWVPKKPVDSSHKPAIVCLREDGVLNLGCVFDYSSTNDAFASAEEMAKANPGKEYVVLQEKGSKRVEPKPSAAGAAEAVAFAISGEIKDKHMSTWKFRNGTSFGVVPVRMNWDYESDEVTIRFRCHRPA